MAQTKAEYDALKAKYSEVSATLAARRDAALGELMTAFTSEKKCPSCDGGFRRVALGVIIFDHFAGCRRW